MNKTIVHCALDVDDKAFSVAIIEKNQIIEFKTRPRVSALIEKLKKWLRPSYDLKICYEASYLGFSLQRKLKDKGLECVVISPSHIPKFSCERVKTDKLDARKMVGYFSKDLLTIVQPPELEDECLRDLSRTHSFLIEQRGRVRRHLLSLCRRMGINYKDSHHARKTKHHWSSDHFDWMESSFKEHPNMFFKENAKLLIMQIKQIDETISVYSEKLNMAADEPRMKGRTKRLTAFRGIDKKLALTLVTEIGDIKRFNHPKKLVSFCGLDIREYSSGGKQRQFGITKMGNPYLRTALVEACQSASKKPRIGRPLEKRRQEVDINHIAIADKCMKRLYKKSQRIMHKGKHTNVAKVACARELLGFVWESMNA